MAYLAKISEAHVRLGSYVGESRHCVAVVKYLAKAPQTLQWRRGARVKGNANIASGSAIATFRMGSNAYDGHAAIYIRQDAFGIYVYDQWFDQPLQIRRIDFRGYGYVSNDGDQFYVIE